MAQSSDEGDARPTSDVFARLQSIASVVAPLTVATAILGYIGWVRYRAIFGYFGISSALVSLTPQDYLLQSGVVGFGGLLLVALAGVAGLLVDQVFTRAQRAFGRRLRFLRTTLVAVGVVMVVYALVGAVATVMRAGVPPALGGTILAVGALLVLRYGMSWGGRRRLLPAGAPAFCMALFLLAGFWALSAYAEDLGNGAARDLDAHTDALPLVTVYSREPLDLAGGNVQPSRVLDQNDAWTYRYTGARLLIYSNGRWFLIVEPSSDYYRSSVTVLPDDGKVRVEVAAPK